MRYVHLVGDAEVLADADLRIRGLVEFFGTNQHGRLPDLRIADRLRAARWTTSAGEMASDTRKRNPSLRRQTRPRARRREALGDRLPWRG